MIFDGRESGSWSVVRILAPAKVNLFLRILGRRPDGYHLLESLIVPVSFYDEILVQLQDSDDSAPGSARIIVTTDSDEAPGGPSNLAARAAALFMEATGRVRDTRIGIHKRIPVGSGLGGGSSDAAAVLLALNRMLGSPLKLTELSGLGARIGADLPFFIHGRPAMVAQTGEEVTGLDSFRRLFLVISWDGRGLSTQAVYSKVGVSLTMPESPITNHRFAGEPLPVDGLYRNDLEFAAEQVRPGILKMKRMLLDLGAQSALMTGSGSAFFGVCADLRAASRIAGRLREHGYWAAAVQTLAMSPAVVG